MRIIKVGSIDFENEEVEFTCPKCGGVFAATKSDIQSGQHNDQVVRCPTKGCGSYIDASPIQEAIASARLKAQAAQRG